jgi:hypothetical protein
MGETSTSPSAAHHLKNCCNARYRMDAEVGEVRFSSATLNASTCSLLMFATAIGIPVRCKNRASRSTASMYVVIVRGDLFADSSDMRKESARDLT